MFVSLYGNKMKWMKKFKVVFLTEEKWKTHEKELEMFSFDKIKDEFIGVAGTLKRTLYEQELQMEILSDSILKPWAAKN